MASVYDDLRERGLDPRTKVLRCGRLPPTNDSRSELHIEAGHAESISLDRLRLAGGRPVALMHNELDLKGGPAFDQDPTRGNTGYSNSFAAAMGSR